MADTMQTGLSEGTWFLKELNRIPMFNKLPPEVYSAYCRQTQPVYPIRAAPVTMTKEVAPSVHQEMDKQTNKIFSLQRKKF